MRQRPNAIIGARARDGCERATSQAAQGAANSRTRPMLWRRGNRGPRWGRRGVRASGLRIALQRNFDCADRVGTNEVNAMTGGAHLNRGMVNRCRPVMTPAMGRSGRSRKDARNDQHCERGQKRPWAKRCHEAEVVSPPGHDKTPAQGRAGRSSNV